MTQTELFSLLPERFTVFLARHATPDRTRFDIPYHIPPGPELTNRGREEAAQLGHFLLAAGVKHILASPFARTWGTASIASEIAGATLEQNPDLAEWRPEEMEKNVLERMQRAFTLAAGISAENGPVALLSHGAPVLTTLKWLGLPAKTSEHHRIYDSRNLVPPAGAWLVQRDKELLLRLIFVPEGVKLPETSVST